jgi:hypothetical protein
MPKPVQVFFAATLALSFGVNVAHAALTTAGCLAQKQKAWGGLRQCEAGEKAKLLQSKPADLAKCTTKLLQKLAKLTAKASEAAIACRYGDNDDGTVTDYDTGLQWEQKTDDASVHDKDNTYAWSNGGGGFTQPDGPAFNVFLGTLDNGTSSDGSATSGCFAGHCDWRLPAIAELRGIVDATQGNCGGGSGPCIDEAVFGPTVDFYWSASTDATLSFAAWGVGFANGTASLGGKSSAFSVRAVRSGL